MYLNAFSIEGVLMSRNTQCRSLSHSFIFFTTGTGRAWKILTASSSVFSVTQKGRKVPLYPTKPILSERKEKRIVENLQMTALEPARKEATMDIILNGAKNLVYDISLLEPTGNRDHGAIKYNMSVSGQLPRKSNIVTFDFKRGGFSKMKVLVLKKGS